jgi:hypothetical protein
MELILEQFKNNFENNTIKIFNEYNLVVEQMRTIEEKNTNLEREN